MKQQNQEKAAENTEAPAHQTRPPARLAGAHRTTNEDLALVPAAFSNGKNSGTLRRLRPQLDKANVGLSYLKRNSGIHTFLLFLSSGGETSSRRTKPVPEGGGPM